MSHLSPDEIADAVEGTLAPTRRTHLDACSSCQRDIAALAAVLLEAERVEVPEPSPLFWDCLSARVHEAVADEPVRPPAQSWMPQWWRWSVLTPMAGLALLILALGSVVSREPAALGGERAAVADSPATRDIAPTDADALTTEETAWALVSELVGPLDIDTAQEAGIATALGTAEHVALQLTAVEQQELVRLLQLEIGQVGS